MNELSTKSVNVLISIYLDLKQQLLYFVSVAVAGDGTVSSVAPERVPGPPLPACPGGS